jgi:hypothetical protein
MRLVASHIHEHQPACCFASSSIVSSALCCVAGASLPTSDAAKGSLRSLEVEGHSFNPDGGKIQNYDSLTPNLEAVAEVFAVCNEARIDSQVCKLNNDSKDAGACCGVTRCTAE